MNTEATEIKFSFTKPKHQKTLTFAKPTDPHLSAAVNKQQH